MRKHIVTLSALVAAFASFAAPFTDGGVTYTPNDEVARRQPVVTGVNVTGMVESVAYTKGEVDRRIETNAPVRSVNGMRGNVKLGAREVGALPDNRAYLEDDANFVNAVLNVQAKSGGAITAQDATNAAAAVVERDVPGWARQAQPPEVPVQSVNGKTGDVSLDYEDVGAWDGRYEVAAALALGYHGRRWLGGTPPYSLQWNSTEKRYRAQWAVGDIPTYEWLAYLSDLDGIDGMTDNAAVLTNGTLKTKGGTAITAANVGAVGTNEYWKVQKGGEGGIGVKLGSAGTYSTFFVGYNNFGEVQNGAHWQYVSGGYEDFFSGSVLRMLTGSQFWWLTGSKPWLQTDTDFHIGGGAYGGGKTLPRYVDDRIDAKATGYVPNTRQVNGHPLSADITLSASDVGAISEEMLAPAVNRVKDLHYDAGLSVTWTNIVDNGHIYYVTVTNTNIVTP